MSKKTQKKIQDFNFFYWFLRYYVDFSLKLSYRKIKYVGKDKIPQDGAVIFAPNHTNALMDALIILAIDTKPKVFVARADIFKNPTLAKIFTFLKIMPIMRQRDGFTEVKKNQEIINKSVDVLRDKIPFCIFPEGTHNTKYSSLPISKGIFRIAFQAQELMPDMPLYIIPTGLLFGDFFRFRSTVRVEIGEPINVGEFISQHPDLSQQEQINSMKELLSERIHSTILYIPDDQDYEPTYEICKITQERASNLDLQLEKNKETLRKLNKIKENEPEKAKKLLELGQKASTLRQEKHISIESITIRRPLFLRLLYTLLIIFTLPYTLSLSILTLPMVLTCKYIFTLLKDPAFKNSVRFLIYLLLWPLLMIVYSIIIYNLLPWQIALFTTLILLPAPIIAHEISRILRIIISDIKLRKAKHLRKLHEQIREMMKG
jgi:1-acyl-sn-glycerol-3-phosphate acyltransferase